MAFRFTTLDPRTIPAATEANEKVFAAGQVCGIEVTVPALAARCAVNIDPQHSGGDKDVAAIEAVLGCELPHPGATLATVRADLDSVGAMAILLLRAEQADLNPARDRIRLVADADKFARGPYPGPRSLPSSHNPWPEGGAAESTRELAAMAAAVADFKIPLGERVQVMKTWLLTGQEPEQYRAQVERERQDLITAIEGGQIKRGGWLHCHPCCSGEFALGGNLMLCSQCGNADTVLQIAVIETTHRAATLIGYCMAPVVVALNPAHRVGVGEPHAKFTICQYTEGLVNMAALREELNALEAGWGGSPTIIGSPQGVGSQLALEQVAEVVARHLLS